MSGRFRWPSLALALALATSVSAQIPVKYVLARQVVLADPSPSPSLQVESALAEAFRTKFEAAFPRQVLRLDTPEQMISPDERVIVIVPTITAARLSDELKAGSIHSFEAVVVGDVSALDPWTDANLFSGTRMVSTGFDLGTSALAQLDSKAREAFWSSANHWLDAAIEQLKANLAPFVLDGPTLAPPQDAKRFTGGIWPFGGQKGVRVGQTLNGGPGRFAKVIAVFPKFSTIQDAVNPARAIPAGESYTLTLVDKPTERPEPAVSLVWVGPPPSAPEGMDIPFLSSDAFLGLFNNYLSKGGGVRILPPGRLNKSTKGQLIKIAQDLSAHTKLVAGNYMAFDRETLVANAAENPDRLVEIGVIERYHGTRTKPDGSVEQYYRQTLGASVRVRTGTDESPIFAIGSVMRQPEELAQIEAKGIRETDPASAFFTLCRNGVINLAKKVREGAVIGTSGGQFMDAIFGPSGIEWKGPQPGAFTPLTWLRPTGEIKKQDGTPLGPLYQSMTPSQGYLNVAIASKEKLASGDILRYSLESVQAKPLVALRLGDLPAPPSWFPSRAWVQRLGAKFLGQSAEVQVCPVEDGAPTPSGVQKLMSLNISALGASTQGATTSFTGQWRCQVLQSDTDPSAVPLIKFGIQSDMPVALQTPDQALQPLDLGGWGLQYTSDALKKLSEAGLKKGLSQTLSATN